MRKSNDSHIIQALASGRLTTDPETGQVFSNGKPVGYTREAGYVSIALGRNVRVLAHRVVWIDANGPIAPGLVINHRNRKRADNRLANLEAITHRQNILHATGSHEYQGGIRPEDLDAVDPVWLADMLQRAADGLGPPERGSGPAEIWIDRMPARYYYA